MECTSTKQSPLEGPHLAGLWIQPQGARVRLDDVPTPSSLPDGSEPRALRTAPLYTRETLLCALWYRDVLGPSLQMSLAIALPSATPDLIAATQTQSVDQAKATSTYQVRVEGRELLEWAEDHGFQEALKTNAAEERISGEIIITPIARSWLEGGDQGPSKGGRGGRGHHHGPMEGMEGHHGHRGGSNGHHSHHEEWPRLS